ncbi:hypothetical protein BDK51DRAFT_30088, partial [Blyttiomyces helicus]
MPSATTPPSPFQKVKAWFSRLKTKCFRSTHPRPNYAPAPATMPHPQPRSPQRTTHSLQTLPRTAHTLDPTDLPFLLTRRPTTSARRIEIPPQLVTVPQPGHQPPDADADSKAPASPLDQAPTSPLDKYLHHRQCLRSDDPLDASLTSLTNTFLRMQESQKRARLARQASSLPRPQPEADSDAAREIRRT